MKRNVAGLVAVLTAVLVHAHPAPADACGVKLTIKTSAPRKSAAHSSNPSQVLLIGSQSGRLERELVAAGHKVEVAPKASAAKRQQYAIVVVDSAGGSEARAAFPGAQVLVRSGDVTADVRAVENQVARRPVRTDTGRAVVAARVNRTPIATGPEPARPRTPVATKSITEPPAPPETRPPVVAAVEPRPAARPDPVPPRPDPAPTRIDATPPVARTPEVKQPAEPKPRAVAAVAFRNEVNFSLGGTQLTGRAIYALTKDAQWLASNASVSLVLEGHADPTGTPEANMELSQKRADVVREFLIGKGVDGSRLEVAAFGDTKLKYGGRDGRNRRVMLVPKE